MTLFSPAPKKNELFYDWPGIWTVGKTIGI